MSLRISIIISAILVLISCNEKNKTSVVSEIDAGFKPLIEVGELVSLSVDEGYAIIDFRPIAAYEKGHIPNALHLWYNVLENKGYPYGGMLPSKTQLEKVLSEKGIQASDTLILYDDRGSVNAARLWWMLDHYGFGQIRILNGGLDAYLANDHLLSQEEPKSVPSNFIFPTAAPQHYISKEQLLDKVNNDNKLVIIDARTSEEYLGKRQKKGAKRAGKIPSSHNLEWVQSIDPMNSKKFLSLSQLEDFYAQTIPDKEAAIVAYCHSGARSSHTTFVLTQLLGYKNVFNYDGSWTEWSYFEDLPIITEVETEIFE